MHVVRISHLGFEEVSSRRKRKSTPVQYARILLVSRARVKRDKHDVLQSPKGESVDCPQHRMKMKNWLWILLLIISIDESRTDIVVILI